MSLWAQDLKCGGGCFRSGVKPNGYAVLFDKDGNEIGRTETLKSSRTCDWTKILFIEADAAQETPLIVKVFHERDYDPELIGESRFEAFEVNQANGHQATNALEKGLGSVGISVVESNPTVKGNASLHFRGLDIRNVEAGALGLGRSDPFFEVAKKIADPLKGATRWNSVYRSEVIDDHLNPFWKEFELGLEELCDGDLDSNLRISVFDARNSGHKLIGSIEVSINQLKEHVAIRGNADRKEAFELGYEETGRGQTGTGLMCVLKCDIFEKGVQVGI